MSHLPSPPLRQRATSDLIVMFLAAIVAVVILVTLVGAIVWKINDPGADLGDVTDRVGEVVNTLVGAIVGYLAGKGVASSELGRRAVEDPGEAPPDL